MKAYQPIVGRIAEAVRPRTILDLPSGNGWLRQRILASDVAIDGIDLYEARPSGYRTFLRGDLETGVPDELGRYDMIVSCEGIEHVANPGLFLKSARKHLNLAGHIKPGAHMHIMPWSWPQLYLHLSLAGFTDIELHPCLEDNRTHLYEKLFALPMKSYCRSRMRKAVSDEERKYWKTAGEPGSLYARRLVVSARSR
jgi:SAM-dependent methyltransferase